MLASVHDMNDMNDSESRHGAGDQDPSRHEVAAPLINRLTAELARRAGPIFVALDGRSGAGKSTLAAVATERLHVPGTAASTVTVIEGDQFYAGGSAKSCDNRPSTERANRVIDWRRQHKLLRQIRSDGEGTWYPFDWDADDWDPDDVPLRNEPVRSTVASVVMLEGAYSARPELHELLDLRVLLDISPDVRRRRLLEREGEEYRADWEARWSAAEDHYFETEMPRERFHLVLGLP
jgi:uridine kinase